MKFYIAAAATLLLGTGSIFAKTISPEEALARLGGDETVAPSRLQASPKLIKTLKTKKGNPAVYVFEGNDNKGYMILSADDLAVPVLGYSETGVIGDEMPPQLAWWLSEYAAQVEYLEKGTADGSIFMLPAIKKAAPEREAIAPLIKSHWDQGAPYNLQCPKVGTQNTYTGCVATAMAQVLNYWQYPAKGTGRISYDCTLTDASGAGAGGKKLALNLAQRAIDWDNMLLNYDGDYTTEQANAVAYLMKACGYSVKMQYGLDSSGALAMNIANALITNFTYDGNINYQLRQLHSTSDWVEMLYNNLKEVGPILYGGGSMIGGGHSFIIDGYKDGLFHFNWGWTGMSDGYYAIDAMNPYALGAGGGGGGGYNFTHDAVLGIQPPTGKPVVEKPALLTQTGSLYAEMSEENPTVMFIDLYAAGNGGWVNYNPTTIYTKFGVIIEPQGSTKGQTIGTVVTKHILQLQPGYGTDASMIQPSLDLAPLALADGTYKVTIAESHLTKAEYDNGLADEVEDNWMPIPTYYGFYNYVTLKKTGDKYEIDYTPVDRLSVVSGKVKNAIFAGGCMDYEFTVTNYNETEISSGFAPMLLKKTDQGSYQPIFLGESIRISLKPGESKTAGDIATLYALVNGAYDTDTEVYFTLYDEEYSNFYDEDLLVKLTLKPAPSIRDLKVVATNPTVKGATTKKETVDNAEVDVYQINDPSSIIAEFDFTLESGSFAYPLFAAVVLPAGSNGFSIINYEGGNTILEAGETKHIIADVATNALEMGTIYHLMPAFGYGNQFIGFDTNRSYFRLTTAGVDDITVDTTLTFNGALLSAPSTAIEVFAINGTKVAEGYDILDTTTLAAGIYIARAAGKTLKFVVK